MPKFRKIFTSDGVLVVVPNSYYRSVLDEIKCSVFGVKKTRLYTYWIDSDNIMWRYPNSFKPSSFDGFLSVERVISQWDFNPEVHIV